LHYPLHDQQFKPSFTGHKWMQVPLSSSCWTVVNLLLDDDCWNLVKTFLLLLQMQIKLPCLILKWSQL